MNALHTVSLFLVMLMFYTSATRGQGPCSQCTQSQCHPVRTCTDSSGQDCTTQHQCVKSNLIMGRTKTCPGGGTPVLTKVMFLYNPQPCSPGAGQCQGRDLYCANQICCSAPRQGTDTPNPPYTTLSPALCRPACRMRCEFGLERDARGCPRCHCRRHPCHDVQCGDREKCSVTSYPCGNSTCYSAKCISAVSPGGCPPVTCGLLCPQGWATDPGSGCPLCQCRADPSGRTDLCHGVLGFTCPSGRHCEMRELPCFSPPCAKAPVCVQDLPCSRIQCLMYCPLGFARDANNCEICTCRTLADCSQVNCGQGRECHMRNGEPVCEDITPPCSRVLCRVFCSHGFARDANNCETCECNPPPDCSQAVCGEGQECRVVQNGTECVDIPKTPCSRVLCRVFCSHGFARDANNCETCECNPPPDCSQVVCGEGQECRVVQNGTECVDIPKTPCARVLCRMLCPHGFARDANNCEICTCKPPPDCSQMDCGAGRQCQMIQGEPVCVAAPETPCGRIQCRMFCPHGFARDANNCEICTCNTPADCSQTDCGMGRECQMTNGVPVCVDSAPLCSRIGCSLACPSGYKLDANNCPTCSCNTPADCSQMTCGLGTECQIVNNEAKCVDILQPHCARAQCRMFCPHGFARDANNCEICQCNPAPDCSQMTCGPGTQCQIVNNEATCVGRSPATTLSPEDRRRRQVECFVQRLLRATGKGQGRLPDYCPPY